MSGFNRQGRGGRFATASIYTDPEDRLGDELNALAGNLPRLNQRKRDLACRLLNEAEKHRLTVKQLSLVRQLSAEFSPRRRSRSKPTKQKSKWQAVRNAATAAYLARLAAPWPIYVREEKGGAEE
jgi:hypothetical protein